MLFNVTATNSKWYHSTERPRSVSQLDELPEANQRSSFHEHKLNCSDYRLQLYDHEK